MEASRARVSQCSLKTGGSAMQMVHVASSRRLHRGQVKDGRVDLMDCVRPCYPLIVGRVPIFRVVRVSRLGEISMLMTKAPNSVGSNLCSHYTMAPLVTNPCTHKLTSLRRLCPYKRIKNTSKNRKEQSRIADE
jgi:hypothetical protein